MTEIVKATAIKYAARIIKKGGTVVFPTETVYGLGADAFNKKAVQKIFKAKGRPSDNPLIVHIAEKKDVHKLASVIPPLAKKLMNRFWPGPLTLVLKKKSNVPNSVTGSLDTVAVRMPNNKIALSLIKQARTPIAAPSANRSGKPSPTDARHVIHDLYGRVDVIIDGGKTKIGLESTVVDVTGTIPELLRPGGITKEQLERVVGTVIVATKHTKAKSPGMKYKHYAPAARLILVEGTKKNVEKKVQELLKKHKRKKIGVLKAKKDLQLMAQELFFMLREFDAKKVDVIIAEGVSENHIGHAIMNRLRKAASEIINT
jgi:L-threonylcarbamoyladenylate synthase